MVARICLMLVCLVLTPGTLAAVSAQLSDQNIDELETVRLTIKITETRQSEDLDLSGLEKDFHVMGTNTISQSRFLNGRGVSWVDYQVTLQPKRTGTLSIPSIKVGNERTPSLELKVRKLSDQTRQAINELVFFENELSAQTIYVQAQVILTRRLLYSNGVQLYSDLPGAPELDDAVVLTLGETRSSTTTRNGNTYGVVEQRYAIFPEISGDYVIPGISITASVRLYEGDRVSRKGVRVGTPDEQITVLPVPAAYPPDAPWLPAENVQLHDVISPAAQAHKVGDTLTHELLVHVTGNIGSVAPPLQTPLDPNDFRVYPASPVINDDTNGDTVKGSRLQTQSLIPLQPGLLKLPTTQITWWDTVNETVRVSETKPITLSVTGQAIEELSQNTPKQEPLISEQPTADVETEAMQWRAFMPYVSAIAALVALTLMGKFLYSRSGLILRRPPGANTRLFNAAVESLEGDDAHAAYVATQRFLRAYFACDAVSTQHHLAANNPNAGQALATLSRHLYDPQASDIDLQNVTATLRAALQKLHLADRQARKSVASLPDLYPSPS